MANTNQDFTTYVGDNATPIVTVYQDAANTETANISSVQEITWKAYRDPSAGGSPVVSKSKTGGGITFFTDGSDGDFVVGILASDTQALTGEYFWIGAITDYQGTVTTVATGYMEVGIKPVASFSGDPANSTRDLIRALVNDTNMDSPIYSDEIYDQLTVQFGGPLNVAAQICRMLAQKYASKASKRVGDLSIQYSDISRNYRAMANDYQAQSDKGASPYAAGISKSDKASYRQSQDRVGAFTTMDQFDNKGGSFGGYMPPNSGGD